MWCIDIKLWSTFSSDAIPIVFEESTYSVGEQDGTLEICAVAPVSLDVSVAVTIQATGGTAQGNFTIIKHQTTCINLLFLFFL